MAIYIGVFLVTLSGLMFEIGLTRIFSATIWYHFAFVAISVALLGWGLGGFALHLLRAADPPSLGEGGGLLTLLYAASIPLCLWLIVRVPFHPERLRLLLRGLAPALPAGGHGALHGVRPAPRARRAQLYFADLLGASVGRPGGDRRSCRGSAARTPCWPWPWPRSPAAALLLAAARCPPRSSAAPWSLAAVGLNERTGAFKIKSAPTQGHVPAHGGAARDAGWRSPAGTPTRASTRSPASRPLPGPALHRLRRLDQHPVAGTAGSRASPRCATGTGRCPSRSRPRSPRP